MSTTCCCCAKRSTPFVLTDFSALIISISSTKANPSITKANCVRHEGESSPYPLSRIIVSRIALIITHMVGPDPFPCPLPWFGRSFGKKNSIEIPNAVLILCVVDCRVFVIEKTTS